MATGSIKRNIVIRDKKSAKKFVRAVEKASSIADIPKTTNYKVRELKDKESIKAFLDNIL